LLTAFFIDVSESTGGVYRKDIKYPVKKAIILYGSAMQGCVGALGKRIL